jgi:hypothetical protein
MRPIQIVNKELTIIKMLIIKLNAITNKLIKLIIT